MFRDDKLYAQFKYWRNFKPEEELYVRLKENPFWPFKQIGDGYFYVSFRSDRVEYGIWILIISIACFSIIVFVLGLFAIAFALFIVIFFFGCWTLHGKMAWRELIVSRRDKGKYMLRIFQNEEIMFEGEIRNIYIRLNRKIDALGDPYFCLILGGYEIDDHRISRMTKAEGPLRIMGMRIAYRVGINFFDWKDESEEHLIWHYKGYSKLKYKPHAQVLYKNQKSMSATDSEGGHLSAPTGQQDAQDDDKERNKKVRISRVVRVRAMNQ